MPALFASIFLAIAASPQAPDPFMVPQHIRLAITPKIDGVKGAEEWDLLNESAGITSFLQWEPGILYAAASVSGKSARFSLDLAGDGWLVGADNLEITLYKTESGVTVTSRLLDCNDRQGPRWETSPLAPGQIDAAAGSDGDRAFVEFKLFTTGMTKLEPNAKMGLRVDPGPESPDAPEIQAFMPRNTALVRFQWDRGSALPAGLQWNSQYGARSVVPGESISVRLNFSSKSQPPFQRVDLRTRGLANASTIGTSFPPMKRDRTFVDYKTQIPADATPGYRVLEGKLIGDDTTSFVESSYRVAETVVFDVKLPADVTSQDQSRMIKGSLTVRSQTDKRLDGVMTVEVPEGFGVVKGTDSKFHIYFSRGSARLPLEISIPAGARGMVPLKLKADIGGKVVETTYLFWIR